MAKRLTFTEQGRRLDGYSPRGAGRTPFGVVEIGQDGEHQVAVTGDGVPTVHIDDVVGPDGSSRPLSRPGRITVDGAAGTISQRRGLRLTRKQLTVTAEVGGRTYRLRMEGLNRLTVRRDGHGPVGWVRPAGGLRLHDRADATDLAVALALTSAIDRNRMTLFTGG